MPSTARKISGSAGGLRANSFASVPGAFTGKELHAGVLLRGGLILLFFVLLLGSGLLAGIYPAVFITRMRLTSLLKGKPGEGVASGKRVRQSLIVTQFAIAITLIVVGTTISLIVSIVGLVALVILVIRWVADTRRDVAELPESHH